MVHSMLFYIFINIQGIITVQLLLAMTRFLIVFFEPLDSVPIIFLFPSDFDTMTDLILIIYSFYWTSVSFSL